MPAVAITVALKPAQTVGLFTVTVGNASIVNIPDADALTQPVLILVIVTEYVPAVVVEKLETFPGAKAADGTTHA